MDSFYVGEIVWGKVKGFSWWPGEITEVEYKRKEVKYRVEFFGENTHAILPRQLLEKFEEGLKLYHKTKQKALLKSIKAAKDKYYAKKGIDDKTQMDSMNIIGISPVINPLQIKEKKNKEVRLTKKIAADEDQNNNICDKDINNYYDYDNNNNNNSNNEEVNSNELTQRILSNIRSQINPQAKIEIDIVPKKKIRIRSNKNKNEDEDEKDLIQKIKYFILYIVKEIELKNYSILDKEKEMIIQILNFLKSYQMKNPIQFLQKTKIGKLIKYILTDLPNEYGEMKTLFTDTYNYLEQLVKNQLNDQY